MLKKIALVVGLLAVGVAIAAAYLHGSAAPPVAADPFKPQTGASADVRIADLERALAAEVDHGHRLEARVAQLESRLTARPGAGDAAGDDADPRAAWRDGARPDPAAMRQRMQQRETERLVAAGFTQDRAEQLAKRAEELRTQAMQARQQAIQNGQPPGQDFVDPEHALRTEIGDAEYERYLTALGRPTDVPVRNVPADSAAARAGLKSGDQIVSYNGTRVFDARDLTQLTGQSAAGSTVTVEVQRDGQTVQLQVPSGQLGVGVGGGRGPGGGPGGRFFPGGGGQ